jgi:hypothetical protein
MEELSGRALAELLQERGSCGRDLSGDIVGGHCPATGPLARERARSQDAKQGAQQGAREVYCGRGSANSKLCRFSEQSETQSTIASRSNNRASENSDLVLKQVRAACSV